jgi:SOS-response transcriptional repressor LexA
MDTLRFTPAYLQSIYMSRYGEALMERREVMGYKSQGILSEASEKLQREDPENFKSFSQQSLSRWEKDRTGDKIASGHSKSLRTLAYLLEWGQYDFERNVGVPIGRVPRLDDQYKGTMFDESPKVGRKLSQGVNVRHLGSVRAGLKGLRSAEDDEVWVEIPRSIARSYAREDMFVLDVEGDSMTTPDARKSIPPGASVVFHRNLEPKPGQVTVCWLESQDIGVLKVARKDDEGYVVLESYNQKHEPIPIGKENPALWQGTAIGWWVPDPFANGAYGDD